MSIHQYMKESIAVLEATAKTPALEQAEKAITTITESLRANKMFLVCGNGGSASDAMHIAGELVGRFLKERPALKCIALSSNPAVLTAWANDYSYDTVFSRQVEAFGESGGVFMGISTSGNSKNVLLALEQAKKMGMVTIGLTGQGGGKMKDVCDILINAASKHTPLIQQAHICLYHYICEKVEENLA